MKGPVADAHGAEQGRRAVGDGAIQLAVGKVRGKAHIFDGIERGQEVEKLEHNPDALSLESGELIVGKPGEIFLVDPHDPRTGHIRAAPPCAWWIFSTSMS
jgi:hypothetical protein